MGFLALFTVLCVRLLHISSSQVLPFASNALMQSPKCVVALPGVARIGYPEPQTNDDSLATSCW